MRTEKKGKMKRKPSYLHHHLHWNMQRGLGGQYSLHITSPGCLEDCLS